MPDALDLANIVDSEVDVFEFFKLVEALHLGDKVALHVQNLQVTAINVQILYLLNVLLVQGDLQFR